MTNQVLKGIDNSIIGENELLDINGVVKLTGFSKSYLYKLTSRGDIPFYKPFGKKLYFRQSEIINFLLKNRFKTNEEIESEVATKQALK